MRVKTIETEAELVLLRVRHIFLEIRLNAAYISQIFPLLKQYMPHLTTGIVSASSGDVGTEDADSSL